ncbi:coiled-coil domain-containing protein 114 isoform X1 [Gadus morhua]|uniref:Outer dynein arm docking complex subunit 1 n=1 Tax=Gadus morhua TaxID=8049 RepID=A0A8C4YZ87_GADMO|nr:coiled-coil domain-containing protein 114-like isoform X1 [Gadus morhua]XP_030231473.1 coiled-coil domain-containing protein 114-like isoform X1 [Gadus morhua]XP_030231474.1 coiled-coil domain-containing protein 114-like isoform X1 [Gadus morhua]
MRRGRSARSSHSDNSDMDIDGIAETEMGKLQRQFRIMDGDRQAYTIQSQELIRKQRQELEKLKKEQEELQRSLGVSENVSRRQQDSGKLRSLLEHRDLLKEELEQENEIQRELQREISGYEKKLSEVQSGVLTAGDAQRSQLRQAQKAIRTLENKLDRALVHFNEQLTKNSHLREDLETLRVERARYHQIHHRLTQERQGIRKEIGEMIHLSTSAYDVRLEAQTKMSMMREKAVKDLAQYNTEMKELERVIAHEQRLKEFMTAKCSERSTQDEGQEMGRRQFSELRDQRRTDSGEQSVDMLQKVFERIQAVTGEDNLDMLVTRFVQVEDRNFALFNFVNEQNNEAEALREQIHQIRGEMEQFQVEGVQKEQERHALLKEGDQQQRETEGKAGEYEQQANAVSQILDQIKTGVNRIFSKMDSDRSAIDDLLGSTAGINENNIMTYLGLVEQKTNELVAMQAFLRSKDTDKDYNPKDLATFILGQNPDMLRQSNAIQTAITGDDHEAEESHLTDEEERPLSQGELRQRIMKGVMRKEGSPQQGAQRGQRSGAKPDSGPLSLEALTL